MSVLNQRLFGIAFFAVVTCSFGCKQNPPASPLEDVTSGPITRLVLTPSEITMRVSELAEIEADAFSGNEPVLFFVTTWWISKGDDVVELVEQNNGPNAVRGLKPGEAEVSVRAANEFVETVRVTVIGGSP